MDENSTNSDGGGRWSAERHETADYFTTNPLRRTELVPAALEEAAHVMSGLAHR